MNKYRTDRGLSVTAATREQAEKLAAQFEMGAIVSAEVAAPRPRVVAKQPYALFDQGDERIVLKGDRERVVRALLESDADTFGIMKWTGREWRALSVGELRELLGSPRQQCAERAKSVDQTLGIDLYQERD